MKNDALCIALVIGLWAAVGAAACHGGGGSPDMSLIAVSDFGSGRAEGWRPNEPANWRVAERDGEMVYELVAPGAQGTIRAPASWSVWQGREVTSFEFTGRLRCDTDPANPYRDMCVVFHFQDPAHFYYVHFAASSDGAHNIIGLVDGADRVKINAEPAGASTARLTDKEWHEFKVSWDARTGDIRAWLDDMAEPVLTARDRTFGRGLVGVGSFDDTGAFAGLTLRGIRAE